MKKKNCIFFGDSITDANHLFSRNPLGEGYLSALCELSHAAEIPFFFSNQGHDGHTLERLLDVFKRSWNHGESLYGPWDLVAIQIGINDVCVCQNTGLSLAQQKSYLIHFQHNLFSLLQEIRKDFSGILFVLEPFLFPYPSEFQSWMNLREQFSLIMQEISRDFHCIFLPLQSLLVGSCSLSRFSLLSTDGIHLTKTGNQLLASFLWEELCRVWDLKL